MTKRNPVESTNIASVGYDPESKELHVEFKSGAVHAYQDVTPEKHEAMINADSIGSHFHHHIRNSHVSRKIAT